MYKIIEIREFEYSKFYQRLDTVIYNLNEAQCSIEFIMSINVDRMFTTIIIYKHKIAFAS